MYYYPSCRNAYTYDNDITILRKRNNFYLFIIFFFFIYIHTIIINVYELFIHCATARGSYADCTRYTRSAITVTKYRQHECKNIWPLKIVNFFSLSRVEEKIGSISQGCHTTLLQCCVALFAVLHAAVAAAASAADKKPLAAVWSPGRCHAGFTGENNRKK